MIISKFNKYVEKHGRVTYIVLGIIICFMFVIFVTPDGAAGGCGLGGAGSAVMMKAFGKKIKAAEFQKMMITTDISTFLNYGMLLSQYSDQYLRQQTASRICVLMQAKKDGFYNAVTDDEIVKKIQSLPVFQNEKKEFDMQKFTQFKENFLKRYGLTARDFDDIIRQDLALQKMEENVTAKVTVSDAELDQATASYKVQTATIPLDVAGAQPTQKEIEAFFANKANLLKLPPVSLRNCLVASFSIQEKNIKITDAELKKYYKDNKDTLYKGKNFEAVKADIRRSLVSQRARAAARTKATDLRTVLGKELVKVKAADAKAAFQTIAKKNGAVIQETGFVGPDQEIKSIPGNHYQLAATIQQLEKPMEFSSIIAENGKLSFAMLLEMKNAPIPEKLNKTYTGLISTYLLKERALLWYQQNVAPYVPLAPATRSIWDLGQHKAQQIQRRTDLNDFQKQAEILDYTEFLQSSVAPFYQPEQRGFTVVSLPVKFFEGKVKLSEEDYQKAYNARKAEYEKKKPVPTLAQVKGELKAELTKLAATRLAMEEAGKLSDSLRLLWNEAQGQVQNKAALLKEKASGIKAAVVNDYPAVSQYSFALQGPARDPLLMRAIFTAKSDQPFSDAVSGTDNVYVFCITSTVAPSIRAAAESEMLLQQIYMQNAVITYTKKAAEKEVARINAGLKAGKPLADAAKPLAFAAVKDAVSNESIRTGASAPAAINNGFEFMNKLTTAKAKTVAGAFRNDKGFALVYMESQTISKDKSARDKLQKEMLTRKKMLALQEYMSALEQRAGIETYWDKK